MVFKKMYDQRKKTGNIKFLVESREICAHREVLAALSPKYRAQFFGPFAKHDRTTVNVKNVSFRVFEIFVKLLYGQTVDMNREDVPEIFFLANESLSDDLIQLCSQFIIDNYGHQLFFINELALIYDNESLKNHFDDCLIMDFESLFQKEEFLNCELRTLCHILNLEIRCAEINIFNVCISWAAQHCKKNSKDFQNAHNLRAVLGEAISKIRFCSMSSRDIFQINKNYPNFLSKNEIVQILEVIENERIKVDFDIGSKDWHPIKDILDVRNTPDGKNFLIDWPPSWESEINAAAAIHYYFPKRGILKDSNVVLEAEKSNGDYFHLIFNPKATHKV